MQRTWWVPRAAAREVAERAARRADKRPFRVSMPTDPTTSAFLDVDFEPHMKEGNYSTIEIIH